MNRYAILVGLSLLAFGRLYFFNVSAQTDAVNKPAVQDNLVNGRLAFSRTTVPSGDRTIIAANSDGTDLLTVAGNYSMQPAWSPDGTKIAFVGTLNLNEIFVVSASGGGPNNLTNSAASERKPSWSADMSRQ